MFQGDTLAAVDVANQEKVDVANQEMQLEVEVVCRPVKVGLVNASICPEAG